MDEKPRNNETCFACKVISVFCLTGIGAYLIHTSKLYRGNTSIFTTALGTGIICLGIGEIFDKSPFRDN